MMILKEKLNNLKDYIKSLDSVAVAFSGGVDSTFLLYVANEVLKENCIALTANSAVFPKKECNETIEFCKEKDIKHIVFKFDNFKVKGFKENPVERCYICKSALFKEMILIAKKNNIKNILEGSNFDDTKDYRPGAKAIEELKILSPLKKFSLTKNEIRSLSKEFNLKTYSKPSLACLATRIPYHSEITVEKLNMIEKSESLLFDLGFNQARVRVHNEIARIEINEDEFKKIIDKNIKDKIVTEFKKLGFSYVSLDLEGYRTGSMNEIINY